uniref:carnitine O-acetyltransferase-like isoform X2 n=1 Tax=Solea senegalensis TaxID=28829 RepID=UPI001CD84851|nr:carnitine O-acetyltransferase-like isoform X2 [Solea senegalensis]
MTTSWGLQVLSSIYKFNKFLRANGMVDKFLTKPSPVSHKYQSVFPLSQFKGQVKSTMLGLWSRTLAKVRTVKPTNMMRTFSHWLKPVTQIGCRGIPQQDRLPYLPLPSLKQTCERYLKILEPIVGRDELNDTKKVMTEFLKEGGVGEKLQEGLEKRARDTENWLTDYYIQYVYLNNRDPVVIFSNTGQVLPRTNFRHKNEQIRFAAEFTSALLNVKTMIDNETLPVDYMRGKPLCMKQYEQMMSTCRVPGLKTDSLVFYGKSPNPPKHITVVHNCQFFVMEVYNSDGTLLTVDQLCVQLEKICNSSSLTNMEPVGILTTQHRDIWGKIYSNLMKDKTNKESIKAIESSIFTVCLDRAMPPVPDDMYCNSVTHHMLHGGGSQYNSGNRWFDKGLQVIIAEDGSYGMNSSHAGSDGIVRKEMMAYIMAHMNKLQTTQSFMEVLPLPKPQKLHFNITPEIKKDIEEAKQHIDKLVQSLGMERTRLEHFGKQAIKALQMSPDSFLQMAFQLAYYRMYQQCAVVFEAASLRTFRLGRIGSINATSTASVAFVKAFDDPKTEIPEKADLLVKAIKEHKSFSDMVMSGQTIREHFLSLKMQAAERKMSFPEKLWPGDKAYNFHISTSQVTYKNGLMGCVGPTKAGEYHVLYGIQDNHIDLLMFSLEHCNTPKGKTAQLTQALVDALLDMRMIFDLQTVNIKTSLKQ